MSTAMPIWCWGKAAGAAAGRAALGKGGGSAGSGPGLRGHNTEHAHPEGSGPPLRPAHSPPASRNKLAPPKIRALEINLAEMVGFEGIPWFSGYENTVFYVHTLNLNQLWTCSFPPVAPPPMLINRVSQEFQTSHAYNIAAFYGSCRTNVFTLKILSVAQ